MSETIAHDAERRLLRNLATRQGVPAVLRRLAARLEASNVGYRLAHGAVWSIAGSALSRLLALAASVATARILGKSGYGELGLVTSTLLTFQAFSSLGMAMTATKYVAELRTTDPARAGRILALSAVVSTTAGLLAAAALWLGAPWLAVHTMDAPHIARPLRIAAIGLFFTTVAGAETGALAGFEDFVAMTRLNVWSGLVGVPLAVLGVWWWGLDGAVWAVVVTAAVQWALTLAAVRARARQAGVPVALRGWWQEQRVLWTFSLPALAQGVMVSPVTWAASAILVNQAGGYLEMGTLSAANQWYSAVLFLPTALGGAVLPVLSERVGKHDAAGSRQVLQGAIAMNAAVVVPVVVGMSVASPLIMGMYGAQFAGTWPTLVVALVTAALVAVTNPVGYALAASNRLWLGFLMNSGWAAVFLGTTLGLVRWGALGVATARLVAYAAHAVWTVWFAVRFVRTARSRRDRVCMVTYGESATSLPPLLHEATSLAAAGFEVESLHIAPASGTTAGETHAPGFRSRHLRLRTRSAFHRLYGRGGTPRGVAALQHLLSYVEFVAKASVRVARSGADVYEAHDLPALLPAVLAAKVRRRPVVYRANELFSEEHPHVRFARFWRTLDRALVPLCDEVVTPEEHRSRIYREELGARRPPLTIRNCPPYRSRIESTRLRDELRARGVPFSTIVLYQGLVGSMRCIEEIVEATRHFDDAVVLVIVGDGFGPWSDPAARLASHARIVVLPRVPYDEVAPYTASADIGILLYRNDCRNNLYCAPNKLFEYMMMGLPVVAPSFPGMLRIVEGEGIGLCVDPAQPVEIAEAVNRLARDADARARMRARALRLSLERDNWENEFPPLLERYRALVAAARPSW